MKKEILNIVLLLILLSRLAFGSVGISDPLYKKGNITYSALTEEPVTGVYVHSGYSFTNHYRYEDGITLEEKQLDSYQDLRYMRSYNKEGLLHGKSITYYSNISNLNNGVLESDGKIKYKDGVRNSHGYVDGLVSNKVVENNEPKGEKYHWDIEVGRNFTGRVHSELKMINSFEFRLEKYPVLQITDYEKGVLSAISLYDHEGYKIYYFEFSDDGESLTKSISYDNGKLILSTEYDKNGKRDGELIRKHKDIYIVNNYVKGIPHGRVTTFGVIDDIYTEILFGVSNKGTFISRDGMSDEELLANIDDFTFTPVDDVDIETFEGYVIVKDNENTYITYLKDGEQIESYLYGGGEEKKKVKVLQGGSKEDIDGEYTVYTH